VEKYFSILFPPFFVAIWIFASKALARMSGWKELAEQYLWNGDPLPNEWRWWRSAAFGKCQYNNCLNLGVCSRGLLLRPMFIFSAGHPTLFIPWAEIKVNEVKTFFFSSTELTFRRCPKVKVRLGQKLARALLEGRGTKF